MTGKAVDYDQLAVEYASHRKAVPAVVEQLVKTASIQPDSQVLEVGCGMGNYLSAVREKTACSAWGCDPSQAMRAVAQQRLPAEQIKEGRGEELPFPDAAFDVVFSVDVIHHMQSPERYFTEAFRVLRPGGMICTVTESSDLIRSRRPFAEYFPGTVTVDLLRYPRISDLKKLMKSAGFGAIHRRILKLRSERTDINDFRNRAFSCLHLITEAEFNQGIARMEQDLQKGPILFIGPYLLLWGVRPV